MPKKSSSEAIFVDSINIYSIINLYVLCLVNGYGKVLCFESVDPQTLKLISRFDCLSLLSSNRIYEIENHLGQAHGSFGESEYLNCLSYAKNICHEIKHDASINYSSLRLMSREWNLDKVLRHLAMLSEAEILRACYRISLTKWLLNNQPDIYSETCTLLITHSYLFPYIHKHAKSQGIRLIAYHRLSGIQLIIKKIWQLLKLAYYWLFNQKKDTVASNINKAVNELNELSEPTSSNSVIGISYYYRSLNLDCSKPSEFFWVNNLDVSNAEILLYNYTTESRLCSESLKELQRNGIKILGSGPEVPVWTPTPYLKLTLQRIRRKLCLDFCNRLLVQRGNFPLYYFKQLWQLSYNYAFWYDFYQANRIRVNVNPLFCTTVAQVLALDALGGVSIGYQYSISNYFSPLSLQGFAGEPLNVQCVFSGAFEQAWRSISDSTDIFIHTGYIYDHSVQLLHGQPPETVRQKLFDHGVQFILCFYDENSVNHWSSLSSDQDVTLDYQYLLEWLLADPTLGLVVKPKKPKTLFQRIASIQPLIKQAQATGRCQFLIDDNLKADIFPATAAMISDLCIGKLIGATAALEAYLAGVKAVLVDTEGFLCHPFYDWGEEQVVFQTWDKLRAAVERYRTVPAEFPGFGNWSPGIAELDPFRDGQASARIGTYIRWVYEALNQGATQREAIAIATAKFAERWGAEHVCEGMKRSN